jgi:hypothetical protein
MANTFKFGNGQWAVKDGYALAYNDENGNFKPLPFDFTRASSSATRVNKQGLIETVASGVPRIDFTDANGALLLEPQRTNLITESALFSGYSGNNEVITDNATTSPDGTLTGAIFADDNAGGTGTVQIFKTVTVDVSSTYTWSVFAKKKDLNFISLRISNFTTPINGNSFFDLNLGTVVSAGSGQVAEIENYGNGWYRCSVTFTTDVADTSGNLQLRLSENGTDTTVDLDNTSNIYIWGWQFEKSNHASSYIPTSGSAVTVVAEVCNNGANNQVINSTEGVLYFEGSALADDGTNRWISLSDGTANNNIVIRISDTNNILSRLFKSGSPVGDAIIDATTDIKTDMKVAIVYNDTSHSLFVNGIKIGTQIVNSSYTLGTLNALNFDSGSGVSDFYGNCKDLQVYNTALTDAELQALTT